MSHIETRLLNDTDVEKLMVLEKTQWETSQTATPELLLTRIQQYPTLCIGSFCKKTGIALASLFIKPVESWDFSAAITWNQCTEYKKLPLRYGAALFGISFTSIDSEAGKAIFEYFYPYSLKNGFKYIFLGSPIPGLSKAMKKTPSLSVEDYVNRKNKKGKTPKDPQLKYYYNKGFHEIVSIQKDYFPHPESKDYGVILKGKIPLSELSFIWRLLPLSLLKLLTRGLFWLLKNPLSGWSITTVIRKLNCAIKLKPSGQKLYE